MTASAVDSNVQTLDISLVRESSINPRKTFDEVELTALASSIAEHGILQNLVVRPSAAEPGKYDIVMGARRYKAAQIAGVGRLPVRVIDASDAEARKKALAENRQRQDVPLLEVADCYEAMMVEDGLTLQQIADIELKSLSTVRAVHKLRLLPGNARDALARGLITPVVAGLIAGRPSPAMREKAAAYCLGGVNNWGEPDKNSKNLPSVRQAKEWMAKSLMVSLDQAPFDTNSAKLLPAAGSCKDCPKRAGNAKDEYPDARPDTCTDPYCYATKCEAYIDGQVHKYRAAGHKILNDSEINQIFYNHSHSVKDGLNFYDAKDQCLLDKKKRSYKQLLEEHVEADKWLIAAFDDGQVVRLIRRSVADPVLVKVHKIQASSKDSAGDAKWKEEQRANAAKERERKEKDRGKLAEVAAQVAGLCAMSVLAPDLVAPLQLAARWAHRELWSNYREELYRRRGIKEGPRGDAYKVMEEDIGVMTGTELLFFLVEVSMICGTFDGQAAKVFSLLGQNKTGKKPGRPPVDPPPVDRNGTPAAEPVPAKRKPGRPKKVQAAAAGKGAKK